VGDNDVQWPADGLETVDFCPVCASPSRTLLYDGMRDVVFRTAPGEWKLYRCQGCQSCFLDPRPNVATIGLAYATYYTHAVNDQPIVRRIGAFRTVLHDLINGYLNHRYGTERVPANRAGRWLLPFLLPLRAVADVEFRHLPKPASPAHRVFDIGCGDGGFLARATGIGWVASGIDPDPKAVANCKSRGIDVALGGVDSLSSIEGSSYDYITASHVLEHVHDPGKMLNEAFRLLRPGGILWLDTPNIQSLGHKRYRRFWRDLDAPRHLVLFNRTSLLQLLRRSGFTCIRQRNHSLRTFPIFAASEAIMQGKDAFSATRGGKPPLTDILAELYEMLWPRRREFLTMTAIKPEG